MHHQRFQCDGDDEDGNVLAAVPHVGIMPGAL